MLLTLPAGPTRVIAPDLHAIDRNTERRDRYAPVFDVFETDAAGEYRKVASGVGFQIDGPSDSHYLPHNSARHVPSYGVRTAAQIVLDDGAEPAAAVVPHPATLPSAPAKLPKKPIKKAVMAVAGA